MCHNSCKRQDHTVRLRYSGILEALGVLGLSEASPYSSFWQGLPWIMRNLLSTYSDAQLATLAGRQASQSSTEKQQLCSLFTPDKALKCNPEALSVWGNIRQPKPPACWWLSVHLSGLCCPVLQEALLLSCSGCLGWEGSTPAEAAGIWANPARCHRQGLPQAGENKRAARDRVNYQANIKRLLTVCPWTSVCCAITVYRNMLSGHSAEVCLCLISLITLFPGSGLLKELSQFSWGGWNHLKTNFHFSFDGWSQANLLLGWCIETPALYFPSALLWPEPCSLWGQNDSCWSHNRGCDLAIVYSSVFLKSWCPSALLMIFDVYLLRSPPLLTN